MEIVITAVGPDNVGLADPIIHEVTEQGANIAEIQMYDHDEAAVFAMMCRLQIDASRAEAVRAHMSEIGQRKKLSVRVWTPKPIGRKARLAICTTYQESTPRAVLEAIRDGVIDAEATVMIGNRKRCEKLATEFSVPWHNIGREDGSADDAALVDLLTGTKSITSYWRGICACCHQIPVGSLLVAASSICTTVCSPVSPGFRPYHDAFAGRMLTYGATCHFIVPELDAGNQTIHQSTFTVLPGTKLEDIIRQGQEENEPRCLVEGVRRVVAQEVKLHFHRIIANVEKSMV